MFCEENFGKINAKDVDMFILERVGLRILSLESADYFAGFVG